MLKGIIRQIIINIFNYFIYSIYRTQLLAYCYLKKLKIYEDKKNCLNIHAL